MKTVKLHAGETFNSKQVFTELLSLPMDGATINEIRKFLKILDVIEKAKGKTIELEDADHAAIKGLVDKQKFRIVHKDLVAIAEGLDV